MSFASRNTPVGTTGAPMYRTRTLGAPAVSAGEDVTHTSYRSPEALRGSPHRRLPKNVANGHNDFRIVPKLNHMSDTHPWLPRKHPDHTPHPREECDIIFVTVCTHLRAPLLANDNAHETLRRLWDDDTHWLVGRYVAMPEHVHLFVVRAAGGTASLKKWISWWKREVTIQLNLGSGRWQEEFWDTRMRSEEHYASRWIYARNNPVRAGLVSNPDLWRYQGEIYILKME